MPYRLTAVIGRFDQLRSLLAGMPEALDAAVAPLNQRMGLIPVTQEVYEQLTGSSAEQHGPRPGDRSSAAKRAFDRTVSAWSRSGPIGYAVASFRGGSGYQTAAVWRDGARAWGPEHTRDFSGPAQKWPINAALALIGVVADRSAAAGDRDLFAELGLGWEQDMEGWQSAGQRAQWATSYDEWDVVRLAEQEREARAAAQAAKYRRLPGGPVALDGKAVMELLGIPPGPLVGAAVRRLQDLHVECGPLSREEAVAELQAWTAEEGLKP